MNDAQDLKENVRRLIEIEKAFGVTELPKARPATPSKKEALSQLEQEFHNCQLCGLCSTRNHVVFGSGNPDAELMFIGEAPGFDEDKQGSPFVGAAGQLLTKIIERGMKIKRESVYIANCLKCRPPQNRSPLPIEIVTCKPILMRQIEIIRPKFVCALGKFAAQTLLQTDEPIGALRGRFFDWNGLKLMPTFHPAYLLRNPADKKLVWQDIQLIMKEMSAS